MTFWWPLTLLVVLSSLSWLPTTEGLKCHICDNHSMKDCPTQLLKWGKIFPSLKECAPTAIACATFRVEPWSSSVVWFQRDCLYPSDLAPFKMDPSNLPNSTEGQYLGWWDRKFFHYAEEANNLRKNASLPEFTLAPETIRRINEDWPINYARIHTCSDDDEDGCNYWESYAVHAYAEGYQADGHAAKLRHMECYQCKVTDPDPSDEDANSCLDVKNERKWYYSDDSERYKVWFHNEDIYLSGGENAKVYGCATLAIYQTSEAGMKPYFERNKWVFGDYWCLLQRYVNHEAGPDKFRMRSLVQYSKVRNGDDDGGEVQQSGCREGYTRALKQKEKYINYNWIGNRVFGGIKEFKAYLKCRRDVRRKMMIAWEDVYPYPIQIPFNETAMEEQWYSRTRGSNKPFAYVGFHFCGVNENCNEWSDKKLYGFMEEPPATTTTSTTAAPTTTTTTRSTTSASTSSSTSFTVVLPSTTPGVDGKGDGEIPDEGCRVDPSGSNVPKSTLATVLIGIWIAAADILSWS